MKFKSGVMITSDGKESLLVAAGEAGKSFTGMIKLNATAEDIAHCLEKETTVDEIADFLLSKYDVSKELALSSVENAVRQFSAVGLLQ